MNGQKRARCGGQTLLSASLLLVACGSSDIGGVNDGKPSAGMAGGHGGGAADSGGAGGSGPGAGGAESGGSGGKESGGSGGLGGSAGNGDGGNCADPGLVVSPEAEGFCRAFSAAPCTDITLETCTELLSDDERRAALACCSAEFTALATCVAKHGIVCGASRWYVSSECAGVEDASQRCLGNGDDCTEQLGPDGAYDLDCDQYAAHCTGEPGGTRECVCTHGSHSGTEFTVDTYDELRDLAVANCK